MTDWIVHFYCPKVPLSIGTTLGALGWLVLKSVFHTRGSEPPITLNRSIRAHRLSDYWTWPGKDGLHDPLRTCTRRCRLYKYRSVSIQGFACMLSMRNPLILYSKHAVSIWPHPPQLLRCRRNRLPIGQSRSYQLVKGDRHEPSLLVPFPRGHRTPPG